MAKGIIGKKIGMTQVFSDNGAVIPVTVVQAVAIMLYKSGSKRYSQKRKLINLWLDISKKQMLSQ